MATRSGGLDLFDPSAWAAILLLRAGDVERNPGQEDYQPHPAIFRQVLVAFLEAGCPHPHVDAFAAAHNALLPRFWTETEDAFCQSWWTTQPVWANPPFSQYDRILEKLKSTGGHLLLLVPGWRLTLPKFWGVGPAGLSIAPGPSFPVAGHNAYATATMALLCVVAASTPSALVRVPLLVTPDTVSGRSGWWPLALLLCVLVGHEASQTPITHAQGRL